MLRSLLLFVIHALYTVGTLIAAVGRRVFPPRLRSLNTPREKLPQHIALVLVSEDAKIAEKDEEEMVDAVMSSVQWCRRLGISRLSVYERYGVVQRCSERIRCSLMAEAEEEDISSGSELEYPLTPPSSNSSRSLSPEADEQFMKVTSIHIPKIPRRRDQSIKAKSRTSVKKKGTRNINSCGIDLNLLSYDSSKRCLASVARYIARSVPSSANISITSKSLNADIEEITGLTSPDLMIIHKMRPELGRSYPPELDGFPPWQISLTEIYHCPSTPVWKRSIHSSHKTPAEPLREKNFACALDEFAAAEMRSGK